MSNVIKFEQLSPLQKRIWEAVQAYPEVEMYDLVTLLDSTKTIVKTGVYRLLALGYLTRANKERDQKARGRKNVYVYSVLTQEQAIAYQKKIGGVPKRDPRPSELAKRTNAPLKSGVIAATPAMMSHTPIISTRPLPPARTTPLLSQSELDELNALRRWKAFAIKLYPQLNQPDEIFEAREILMRQYPNDAKHREDIGVGKHDSGPAMMALIEVLQRKH